MQIFLFLLLFCPLTHLSHIDQRRKDGTSSENQPAGAAVKRTSSVSLKSEGAEGIYQDYHPGMTFICSLTVVLSFKIGALMLN